MEKGTTTSKVVRRVAEAKAKGDGYLNLGHFGLEKIPEEIFKSAGWLTTLNLSQTQVGNLTPLQGLTGLNELYLSDTQVSDLTPLQGLTGLTGLYLSRTQVSDLTPLQGLTGLTTLNLSTTPVSDLTPLQGLTGLTTLNLSTTQLSDLTPLQGLTGLTELDFSRTQVSDLTPLQGLTGLTGLNLSSTQVSDLKPILTLIKNGIAVKSKYDYISKGIYIEGCPLLTPPLEVVQGGNESIIRYFEERKKQGEENLYEAKIVIIGAGESGKTTLIQKLLNPGHPVPNAEDKRTEGIRITSLPFAGTVAGEEKKLKAHIWDFGGQEIYHTTHQLFLTQDTLYILLNDNRKNDTDFYYWLNIVSLRAGDDCPILMVFNAKEGSFRQITPGEDLFKEFPNLVKEAVDVNFADKDIAVFHRLKQSIQAQFCKLQILQKPYPAYWIQVRDALSEMPDEYLELKEFAAVCKKYKVEDEKQIRILAQTLHNLGSLLYFPNIFGLEEFIVLRSQWCVDAIYAALDTPEIKAAGGRFNLATLAAKWTGERFVGKHLQLLALMQYFDLCYAVPGTKDYIAPQLLPLEEARYPRFPQEGFVVYRFDYTFMPAGMLTRLIARLSNFIKAPYVWRFGVTLEWEEGTLAEVLENGFSRQIVIRIAGKEQKRRLREIRKTLHDIHASFRGLKCTELVACNCEDCRNDPDPTTFDLVELEDNAEHNDDVICRNGKRKRLPARQILEGIAYEDLPRIFISYAHKNETFKDEFRTMIKPLEREGKWKVWDDRWLLPGDKWNGEILRHLSEANVIVLMLTADFFGSDYIYDIELSKAIQRHKSGDALVIGIVVSDCLWEETPLREIQIIPKDGLAVEKHGNRSEVWKEVANKIKETIAVRSGQQKRRGGYDDYLSKVGR